MGAILVSSNASTSNSAWLALAVAAVTLLGLLFLILMYVFSSGPIGMLNDVCIAVAAALSVALAWTLYPLQQARSPQFALPALILAAAGAVIVIAGSALSISGTTGFVLAGLFMVAGNALIGLWLLGLNYGSPWPRGLVTFGLIAGGLMAVGLLAVPGIFARTDSFETSSWLTWIGQMGFFGYAVLFPVWCLRLWTFLRAG